MTPFRTNILKLLLTNNKGAKGVDHSRSRVARTCNDLLLIQQHPPAARGESSVRVQRPGAQNLLRKLLG